MFVFIWGSTRVLVQIGSAGERMCRACQQSCMFHHVLQYDYAHFYHIFGLVIRKRFREVCERCGNSWVVPETEISNAKSVAKTVIPFMRRRGLILFLLIGGLTLGIGGYFFLEHLEDNYQRNKKLQEAPLMRPVAPAKPSDVKGLK
jgi:hypothetical protein